MKESDWKVFVKLKDKAIEMFCSNVLSEIQATIADESEHPHDRYLVIYKYLQSTNKKMATLFDGHSRSIAPLQLMLIRQENLADEALLAQLSEELLAQSTPVDERE